MSAPYPYRFLRWLIGGLLALAVSAALPAVAKASDVLMQRYNIARTGSTSQPGINPQTVQSPRWGNLGRLPVDGIVYAQPLYVESVQIGGQQGRDLVFVATGSNQIYAFDARTLSQVWHVDAGLNDKTAIGKALLACDRISLPGGIGIEATPVIDRASGLMYVSYRTNPSGKSDGAQQHLRAIDIRDGHQVADVQVLPPQAPADWTKWHRSRAGLLLLNGVVYLGFASRCEDPGTPGFHGWLLGYAAKTLQRLAAFSPTLNMPGGQPVDGGGIWQGASGLSADEQGSIYTATGNRRPDVDGLPRETPSLADSFIKLTPVTVRDLHRRILGVDLRLVDWFTPYRRIWLDDQDLDLAASGPLLIPGTSFLLGGGKSGIIYLLDRGNMGKFDQAHAWTSANLNSLPLDMVETEAPEDYAADKVVQKFKASFNQYVPTGSPYLPRSGAPIATAPQGPNQLDLFAVGRDGAVYAYWEAGGGPWTDGTSGRRGPAAITPAGLATVNAHVASSSQGSNQLDVFVVGKDGAMYATWVAGSGHWADGTPGNPRPARISPTGLAPPGAGLAVGNQGANQLDAFVVGNDGAVHVTWVVGAGHWSDGMPGDAAPVLVTPARIAPPGAPVSSAPQGANQLDAFVVGKDGAAYVTWVTGAGHWADGTRGNPAPARITPLGLAPPGASVAAAAQSSNQLDAFMVGKDGAAYVTWVTGAGHWADGTRGNPAPARITPLGLAPPGACVTAVRQNVQQLDAFVVGKDGAVYVTWVVGLGHWADGTPGNPPPARITPTGLAKPGSCVAAAKQSTSQMDAFVAGLDGALYLTFEVADGRWTDGIGTQQAPVQLDQAVWMKGCWPCWPHIHGPPVFAAFSNGQAMIYVWPEKDHLKAYKWLGNRVDSGHPVLATDKAGRLVLAPPGPPFGMPGGMLAVSVDPGGSGVVFGSIARPEGAQSKGMLRAFDPFSMKEIWNNAGTDYDFVKFVPPTIAGGKVFLPTGSNAVIVYGLR